MNLKTQKISAIRDTSIFLILILFAILLSFGKFSYAVQDGIALWIAVIVPSLFPYLFITTLLSNSKTARKLTKKISPVTEKLFKVGGSVGYAFFLSALSGYPLGAKLVSDLKTEGAIGEEESVRGIILCSTSSPSFTIGSVGSIMFGNVGLGVCLYLCNIISTLITAFLFSLRDQYKPLKQNPNNSSNDCSSLYDLTYSSIISLLVVGGIITLFYLLSEILFSIGILNPVCDFLGTLFGNPNIGNALTYGIIESTNGLKHLSEVPYSVFSLPLSAMICGFGGISVLMQSLAFIKKAKIKTASFLFSKVVNAALSFVIGITFSLLFL